MASYWIPTYLQGMKPYLDNPNVSGMYGMWDAPDAADVNGPNGPGVPGEGGVDLDSPQGTPVYALADGPIIGIGYWKDQQHGVVTTRVNVPGHGENDIYYQHIIFDPKLKSGQTVKRGQQIGTIGTLGEIEVGFNANWGQPWGENHPAGWVKDPRPLIEALMAQGNPGSSSGNVITVVDFMDSIVDTMSGHPGHDPNIYNFMIAWAQKEGGGITNNAAFNPLNTKQQAAGSTDAGHGIQAYPDDGTGIKATIAALNNGLYGALVHAITTDDLIGLGFDSANNQKLHQMAKNIAAELMIWNYGHSSLTNTDYEGYVLDIMQLAGISNASIEGGNVESSRTGQSQAGIDAYGQKSLGPDASGLTVQGAEQNASNALAGLNNFFAALQNFFSNPVRVIKILGGAAMVILGLVLLARSLMPGISIGGKK